MNSYEYWKHTSLHLLQGRATFTRLYTLQWYFSVSASQVLSNVPDI